MVERETLDGVEMTSGVGIIVSTADFKLVRGRTVLLAIFNETAFWPSETSASPDIEVHRAVQPAMATLPDAMLIMISSAYRRDGLLYQRWKRFYGFDDQSTLVIHAKTRDLNPMISPEVIAAAFVDDPESAKAEWESLWRDDLASYMTRQEIDACVDRGITARPRQAGVQYVSWIDASSGAGKDSMCCAIGHRIDDNHFVVDCVVEICPPFSPPDACAQIANALKSYGITRTMGDRWGASISLPPSFSGTASPSNTATSTAATSIARRCRSSRQGARLIDNERMIGQFANLERRVMAGGREVIDHPQRGNHHDDVSLVVAGVLVAMASPVTGPEAMLEFYRQVEEPWRFSYNTDTDPVAPPSHGWQMADGPLLDVIVPPIIATEGKVGNYTIRRIGDQAVVSMTKSEAARWLQNKIWASLNEKLAKELLDEDVA